MNHNLSTKKPKVLIVEDELESQKYFEIILRNRYDIDFCDNKNTMYSLLDKNNYDVIIMDISLKDNSNGVELIRELKKSPRWINTPIICLSAHAYSNERLSAEKAGADVYLTKPIKRQTLLSSLDELILISLNGKETS